MGDNVHKGHRERLKKRFLEEGLDSFTEVQVLELLLFYCIPRQDTNVLAHKILDKYGTLANVFESNAADIEKTCGISFNSAVFISLISGVAKRYYMSKWRLRVPLDTPDKAAEYCISLFTGRIYETFYLICLDRQMKLIATSMISEGSINETPVYPRKVVEVALRFQADSVILSHNHPGGNKKPSTSDIEATNNISAALNYIAIDLVDHIIVSGNNTFSFMENNLLPR